MFYNIFMSLAKERKPVSPKARRSKVGLALGDGGPRGLAHIGVIKALEENDIPVDFISGSSAGALIGGLYASNKDIKKIEKIFLETSWQEAVRLLDISFKNGLIRGDKITDFLKTHLGKSKKIESCAVPFSAVATDLKTGKTVVLNKGDLADAIRASISVPMIFNPCLLNDKFLIDGGVSMPVPVDPARAMGADNVIAVNLYGHYSPDKNKKDGALQIALNSYILISHHLAKFNVSKADTVIVPKLENITILNINRFFNGGKIIRAGYEAALEKITEIKKIITKN